MRISLLLFSCWVIAVQGASAQSLSEPEREAHLLSLKKMRETVDSTLDAKYRVALTAYRQAAATDTAAMELYLNCIEKVNFKDQSRKSSDFREWRRKEADTLSDSGLRLALRHQLRWLILTLQATSENADRQQLATSAQEVVDAIFSDLQRLRNQKETLSQPVTASVFARAYEISSVKVEDWPLSPIPLDQVYDQLLLPPYRTPSGVTNLRSGWIKRIQQEIKMQEHGSGISRNGSASSAQSPQSIKFMAQTVPNLQWQMELDLFSHGDESGAASRMLAHLEKNISHPNVRNWTDQFMNLLSPSVVPADPAPPAAPE